MFQINKQKVQDNIKRAKVHYNLKTLYCLIL